MNVRPLDSALQPSLNLRQQRHNRSSQLVVPALLATQSLEAETTEIPVLLGIDQALSKQRIRFENPLRHFPESGSTQSARTRLNSRMKLPPYVQYWIDRKSRWSPLDRTKLATPPPTNPSRRISGSRTFLIEMAIIWPGVFTFSNPRFETSANQTSTQRHLSPNA